VIFDKPAPVQHAAAGQQPSASDLVALVTYEPALGCEVLDAAVLRQLDPGLEGDRVNDLLSAGLDAWMGPAGPRRPLALRRENGRVDTFQPREPAAPTQEIAFDTRLLTGAAKLLLVCSGFLAFVLCLPVLVWMANSGGSGSKFLLTGAMACVAFPAYIGGWKLLDKRGVRLRR
jgi:hypothetical protein